MLPAFPSVVLDQVRVLLRDLPPDAIKIGMLASDDVARNVGLALRELPDPPPPIVVDPVLAASDGTPLLERRGWAALEDLMGRAAIVTPNAAEAAALTGCDAGSDEGVEAAACALLSNLGAGAALVTGGDRPGPPRDLLALREGGSVNLRWLDGDRIGEGPVHGTGCALSSAVAAFLARGEALAEAVEHARAFVAAALRRRAQSGSVARLLAYGPDEA